MTSNEAKTITNKTSGVRVLMVADDFPPLSCGVGDYAERLCRALVANGVVVRVITKRTVGACAHEIADGVDIRRVINGWFMSEARSVLKCADDLGARTVVHIQYSSRSNYFRRPMINCFPAICKILRAKHPVIVTMHGFHEQRYRWRARALPMLFAADARVFVNAKDYTMVSQCLGSNTHPSSLIPIASNIPDIALATQERDSSRKRLGCGRNARLVVFFGDIRPDKGIESLIRAVASARIDGIDARLVLLGSMDGVAKPNVAFNRHLSEILAQLDLREWLSTLADRSPDEVARIISSADLAVFPFTLGASENRGSLLAALANGMPVLTTRGPSTPPFFETNYGVETVPAGDETALIAKTKLLLCSDDRRRELALRSQAAAGALSWDTIATRTVEVYRSVLEPRDKE